MSLIWSDSFDHYGNTPNGGRDAMLLGAWSQFSWGGGGFGTVEVSSEQARTGSNSLKLAHTTFSGTHTIARRVIGASRLIAGVGYGIYLPTLPVKNKWCGMSIRNNANANIVLIAVESDGSLGVYSGSGETLIGSSDPVITASTWHHIEPKVIIDDIVGEVEIRVNDQPVIHLTDQDLGSVFATQLRWGTFQGASAGESLTFYIDDINVWDDNGTENNDFMGPQRVTTRFAVADTGVADWAIVGESTGYEAIDDVPPDSDTTYITSDVAAEVSEFTLDTLPPETEEIAGVYIPMLGRLVEAGIGNVQVSLVSGGVASDGPDQGLTQAYTYWGGVHELDPDTGLPWTKTGLEAALLRVTKTV